MRYDGDFDNCRVGSAMNANTADVPPLAFEPTTCSFIAEQMRGSFGVGVDVENACARRGFHFDLFGVSVRWVQSEKAIGRGISAERLDPHGSNESF